MMDNLLVDLDKVLDDFEAEENSPPGQERKPSGFQEYLEKSYEPSLAMLDTVEPTNISYNGQDVMPSAAKASRNVMYDFPYEPEKFDLSEADFAPSLNLGDSGYNGSVQYSQSDNTGSVSSDLMNGGNEPAINKNLQNQYDLSKAVPNETKFLKNNLEIEKLKLPVQADNSPDAGETTASMQMNGHFSLNEPLLPKQSNVDSKFIPQTHSISLPNQFDHNMKPDFDKYPIQCNTPQTPKDAPTMDPLASHFAAMSESKISQNVVASEANDSSQNSMQNLPKLQSLKSNLEHESQSVVRSESANHQHHQHNTQSLPASFSEKLTQNNIQGSWPTDGSSQKHANCGQSGANETHSKNNGDAATSLQQMNGCSETLVQNAVGFDHVEEDIDEKELTAYLGESTVGHDLSHPVVNNEKSHLMHTNELNQVDTHVVKSQEFQWKNNNMRNDATDGIGEKQTNSDSSAIGMKTSEILVPTEKAQYARTVEPGNEMMDVGNTTLPAKEEMKPFNVELEYKPSIDPELEVLKILPVVTNDVAPSSVVSTVISEPETNISPTTNVSIDSGCASMSDNTTVLPTGTGIDSQVHEMPASDVGARPKDIHTKVHRPNSLVGLSTVNLNSESPFLVRPVVPLDSDQTNIPAQSVIQSPRMHELITDSEIRNTVTEETRQRMETGTESGESAKIIVDMDVDSQANLDAKPQDTITDVDSDNTHVTEVDEVEMRRPSALHAEGGAAGRPHSWSPPDSGQPHMQKQKRPTSLNLPPRPEFHPDSDGSPIDGEISQEEAGARTGEGAETREEGNEAAAAMDVGVPEAPVQGAEGLYVPPEGPPQEPPPPYSTVLGKVAPIWVPDSDASACMSCETKFTFTKRRHHCRACGKVFCSACCNMKNKLVHLKNQEARVCFQCHQELATVDYYEAVVAARSQHGGPHPNNPREYCSMVPPAAVPPGAQAPPPSVMVPVQGVLKRDGNVSSSVRREGINRRSEPKQVMFSDGIRPGGDLTELDGSTEAGRMPPRRTRVQKRVERVGAQGGQHSPRSRRLRTVTDRSCKCFIPEEGLPPLAVEASNDQGYTLQPNPDPIELMPKIRDEESPPIRFAINTNLYVLVKILHLDCCVNRTVWCFTTQGMSSVGQEEIITILETTQDETTIPRDIFSHVNSVYDDASKGNTVSEMGHYIFNQQFMGSREHGGFLYIRSTFQCVQKLILPKPPYLFAILLQKWETPWAKVFPIRLLLRLGAEYRYYPCPLIGVRNRKPVFFEIGHTIMNLLADFRNYQYMLPCIHGISIHMEDKLTTINFPRNRYDELMKVVNNSNEHVMAIAANFSADADSHLVCIQNDDGNYQTQAINIQNKPRKVTGASFVVFNGALKTSSGLSAKSSIVEDGLMVQITPDSMLALKQSMKDMQDYTITCGVIGAQKHDETVIVQWADDDKNVNIGVESPVDGMSMDGIQSLQIHNSTDYVGEHNLIRWTEIFFIQNEDSGSVKWEPVDLSRLGETLATACCVALTPHLEKLKEACLTRIGLRVTLGADNVGYEAGAKSARLPDVYMNDLDNELIPVIHRATQQDGNIVLELIFQVLD